jgi:hypothetical protein
MTMPRAQLPERLELLRFKGIVNQNVHLDFSAKGVKKEKKK